MAIDERSAESTPGLGIINVKAFSELSTMIPTPSGRGLVSSIIREMLAYHTDLNLEDREGFIAIQEQLDPGSSRFNKPPKQGALTQK